MFEEPNEESAERAGDPATQAREKADEFRMFAELAAVFEAVRKYDAELLINLHADTARDIQRTIGRLEKAKSPESPILPEPVQPDAKRVLELPKTNNLTTNDYHIHRRPGEVMIVRWLAGEEVDRFYQRLQAHFDTALEGFREDERSSLEWKQDQKTAAYLAALDKVEIKLAERYLREPIRTHNLFVLSTQTADEINIVYLTDQIMGITPAQLVGSKSAPPDEPSESDLAWFFKLFSLRGVIDGVERMCFFTYLQKSDDLFSDDE